MHCPTKGLLYFHNHIYTLLIWRLEQFGKVRFEKIQTQGSQGGQSDSSQRLKQWTGLAAQTGLLSQWPLQRPRLWAVARIGRRHPRRAAPSICPLKTHYIILYYTVNQVEYILKARPKKYELLNWERSDPLITCIGGPHRSIQEMDSIFHHEKKRCLRWITFRWAHKTKTYRQLWASWESSLYGWTHPALGRLGCRPSQCPSRCCLESYWERRI